MTTMVEEVCSAIQEADQNLPKPTAEKRYLRVPVHTVEIVPGEKALIAFGHIPFERMLEVVNAHAEDHEENVPYTHDEPNSIQHCLGRITYRRVRYVETETGFELDWLSGLTPITVWRLDRG